MTNVCYSSAARPTIRSLLTLPLFPIRRPTSIHLLPENSCFSTVTITRRKLALLFTSSLGFASYPKVVEANEEALEMYADQNEGFFLLKPATWTKVDKAGATALFVREKNKSDTIGVVVSPVRLSSLKDFGTPDFVAEKLIQAERRKESTKSAEVINIAEREGTRGLPVYEFEYSVDSTRGGLKRIFSAVLVDARKLYILNITASDKTESPIGPQDRKILENVLHSFNVVE